MRGNAPDTTVLNTLTTPGTRFLVYSLHVKDQGAVLLKHSRKLEHTHTQAGIKSKTHRT